MTWRNTAICDGRATAEPRSRPIWLVLWINPDIADVRVVARHTHAEAERFHAEMAGTMAETRYRGEVREVFLMGADRA